MCCPIDKNASFVATVKVSINNNQALSIVICYRSGIINKNRENVMNSEDRKKIDTCRQKLAEVLYRNMPTEELDNFEEIESVIGAGDVESAVKKMGMRVK
ncbi:hypothetical protein [Chamaesiphon sp. OTE_75_metabat_556]|uniref:hypothetical protein n=1 Tax=Chamaesiphon sp. OTE_75_metabat_556 TaxID=2964692 RepID=UPI00286D5851|nr:hypothetical protein [Chamaesiphon sp. OTE_75_metabat_556]